MSYLRRFDAATTAEWPDLIDEFDRWAAAGRVATLWWRDDDATAATRELDAFLGVARDVPVALAVIPALARPDLVAELRGEPRIRVLQHGWEHRNRAGPAKKSEYPADRVATDVAAELGAGRTRLAAMFGAQALPVLVPPWNRIAAEFLPLLPEAGLRGVSAMASFDARPPPPGLVALDVHIDLVAWREGRGFIGTGAALGRLVGHLQANRFGAGAPARPIGILTHHLILDAATSAFLARLVALTRGHGAARWAAADEFLQ